MEQLKSYYTKSLRYVTIGAAFIGISFGKIFVSPGFEQYSKWLEILASTTLFSITFLIAEWLINKKIWRLKFPFLYSKYDCEGKWVGVTIYENLEIPSDQITFDNYRINGPKKSFHDIIIKQDAKSMALISSTGEDFIWNSLAVNLVEVDGTIEWRFAYEANYHSEFRFPNSSKGLGIAKVIKYDDEDTLKPIVMSGVFYHCAMGYKPIFRGKTVFVRAGFLKEQLINSLNISNLMKVELIKNIK